MPNNNVASFPYAAPSDAVLSVASNNAATILASDVGATDTSIPVVDTTNFNTPCLLVIDSEIILAMDKVDGTNTFTGCMRGFSNTTKATHASGADVFGYIVSYQHNQIAAELKSLGAFIVNSDISGLKTSENLIYFSEDFSNIAWSRGSATVALSGTSLPNGSLATTLTEGNTLGLNGISTLPNSLTSGATYTFSIYAKYVSTAQWLVLGQRLEGPENNYAFFDLLHGLVGTVGSGVKASIVKMGSTGWYRCMVILSCTANVDKTFGVAIAPQDATFEYLGTGVNNLLICGAQVQSGDLSGPMTYIKTSGTTFSLTGSGDLVLDEGVI